MTAGGKDVLWTSAATAAATGGRCETPFEASGVSIDSRTVEPGDLFVAIVGPHHDGHGFVAEALSAGAAAAVVHRVPIGVSGGPPVVMVGDTLEALEDLAAAARVRTGGRVIAVTGSVGKTGIKEVLGCVLAGQGPVAASRGSLNNKWGLPLSLARMPPETAYGIFEMGMNHPGEIEPLSRLTRPHVALVTAVEAVHGAFFAGLDEIAEAKAEVFAGLEADGTAVLDRDNPYFDRLADAARARGAAAVIGFGAHHRAEVRLGDFAMDEEGSDVEAVVAGRALSYRVGLAGRHWVTNSLAVLATVEAAGGEVAAAARALGGLSAIEGRGRRHTIDTAEGGFELIDESYNASPVSMNAAIQVLGAARPGPGGRRIAVLGDMLELGEDGGRFHEALAAPLEENGIDLVFTAGPDMARLADALPKAMRGGSAATAEELAPLVLAAVRPGDVVTVKGSLGSRTGKIVRALLERAAGNG